MYELNDQTWKSQPRKMSEATLSVFLTDLETYMLNNSQNEFTIILHGGEPLLAGKEYIQSIFKQVGEINTRRKFNISINIQTNAVLLDQEWLDLFKEFNCLVGISHDGPAYINDVNRIYHNGSGTSKDVEKKIELIIKYAPEIFTGILTVINPHHSGKEIVEYYYKLGVPKIDILFPDQNHQLKTEFYPSPLDNSELYSTFLKDAYNAWRQIDDPNFDIRFFRELVYSIFGRSPKLDSLGTDDVDIFVLETDGGLEPIDTFKCCGEDFTKLDLSIHKNSIQDLERNPLMKEFVHKSSRTSEICVSCEFYTMCGGGYMPHRFNGEDFSSPSVYCESLKSICQFIKNDISSVIETTKHNMISN